MPETIEMRTMMPQRRQLVTESWKSLAPNGALVGAIFYRRLFEIDPSLESMFRGDMAEQRRKLMFMLTAAVKGLPRLDRLIPVLEDLGRRHVHYGVVDHHYETVGEALIWTLEKGLGSAFTPDVREAWITVYGVLAATMKAGAVQQLAEAV